MRTAVPSLRAGQVVGVLAVPGATVEILPKIDGEDGSVRRALTRMLAVAWDLPVADSEPALLASQRENLLEVLVRLFADRLLTAVRRGLPHRYRTKEEDLPLLRGKLDVTRQVTRHVVRPNVLACRFGELSVNTPLNRVLRAAVARVMPRTRSEVNRRRLAELMARFEFVGDSSDALGEFVRLDRTNLAFHRLHSLAQLFLRGVWQSTTTGGNDGIALLFAMNALFEEFIARSMVAALTPRRVRLQHAGRFALCNAGKGLFALQPDMVVDGETIVDTKWKELATNNPKLGVRESDVYQMLAYARAYEARRLVLLYPWHEGLPEVGLLRRWRVAGTATVLDVACVDVGKPDSVVGVLRAIVDGDEAAAAVSRMAGESELAPA